MKNIFVTMALLVSSLGWASEPKLEPNDVSILMPLPKSSSELKYHLHLLTGESKGSEKIFPAGMENQVKDLFSTAPGTPSDLYKKMLVTAFRYDPCFPTLKLPVSACKGQVRLTAQFYGFNGSTAVFDEVALHLFYQLTPKENVELAHELARLKKLSPVSTSGRPLFIHPALEAQGMQGAWGVELKKVITKYARINNLFRVTGMAFVFDSWPFFAQKVTQQGRVMEDEPLKHLKKTNLGNLIQSWDIFGKLPGDLGNLTPESKVETGTQFFSVLANYISDSKPIQNEKIQKAIDSVERLQNPKIHHADSVDCVSCHVAGFAKFNAITQGVKWTSAASYSSPAGINVQNKTHRQLRSSPANLIQFGYFLRNFANHGLPNGQPLPSVSDRVIFESIEVADFTSKHFLK
jgi:hypothetical protein